ncbi:MAG: hypothetical protein AB7O31_07745 [Burkholderiales bacterium]
MVARAAFIGIAAISAAAMLGGCASPYAVRTVGGDHGAAVPKSLPDALAYSRATRETYRAKVIELGESEQGLTNALVTLGGLLVAAGAGGAHRDALVGGAILGGTAYSLGIVNTDKRRAVIYVAGMKALSCAEHAVTAMNFDDAVQKRLDENMRALRRRSIAVENAIANVERLAGSADAAADVQAARQAQSKAIAAQSAADQLIAQRSIAGGRLATVVDEIDRVILDAINGTVGSLEAVPQIIGGLVKASQVFAPTVDLGSVIAKPAATGPNILESLRPEAKSAAKAVLDKAVAALKQQVLLLEAATQRMTALVATFDAAKALDALKDCKVDGLPAAMKVDATELKFTVGAAGNKTVVIEGGKAPYYAYIEGAPAGLSVENPQMQVLIVSATDKVAAGDYRLIVQDNTRQARLVVPIAVAAKK